MHPIEKVWNDGLCTGCGTCAGICSLDAIKMSRSANGLYKPIVDDSICNDCNECPEVCPGYSVDFIKLNKFVFNSIPEDSFLGYVTNCYLGHCVDRETRWKAASGGIVSALLLFMLDEGMIDGALVTRMKEDNPLEPQPFIARTKEEVIAAATSKYCPVPANIALKEILESKDNEKFAVVGLPCHIHGARKAEMINQKLKEKIVLHIGIFCSQTISFLGTEFLLQKRGIKKEDVKQLKYRGEGWPGGMSIELKNGSKCFYPYSEYYRIFSLHFFAPTRCMICCDGANELADISCCDAWLAELREDKVGESIVLSRTSMGEGVLQAAQLKGRICLSNINRAQVILAQHRELFLKKGGLKPRYAILKTLGRKMPSYNLTLSQKNPRSNILGWGTILFYIIAWCTSNRHLYRLLQCTPFSLLLAQVELSRRLRHLLVRLFHL